MKITSFNPLVITPKADDAIKLFEEMGFERRHAKTGIDEGKVESVDMRHPDGFVVDVASAPVPQDILAIRVNVDDFDATRAELEAKGFKAARDEAENTGTSKAMLMFSPTGFAINLCEHLKG